MQMLNEELEVYLNDNGIKYDIVKKNLIKTNLGLMLYIEFDKDQTTFDFNKPSTLSIELPKYLVNQLVYIGDVDYYIYKFGELFYYTENLDDVETFNELRNIGKNTNLFLDNDVFLGLHGKYELMSGTRNYSEWINKAKFLNINHLGICEKNTLAGSLPFQLECQKNDINPIIGYTAQVENKLGYKYELKFYVINEKGWRSLLNINYNINVLSEGIITEEEVLKNNEGLCVVIPLTNYIIENYQKFKVFNKVFFHITSLEYKLQNKDKEYLLAFKKYFRELINEIPPILIDDAYVLEKEDQSIKDILSKQGNVKFTNATRGHYFKSFEESILELSELFDSEDDLNLLIFNCFESNLWISDNCKFKIETKKLNLPKYELTEKELKDFENSENLFWDLINKGIQEKIDFDKYNEDIIYERIEKEFDIISRGGFIDYFLILWDIIRFCDENSIEVGTGRGSAAGSLISYLLGIVKLNPLDYDLLFERFLNDGRLFIKDKKIKIVVESECGEKINIYNDTYLTINRNNEKKYILGKELIEGDEILSL